MKVPSASRPGLYHEVQLEPVVRCTCEGFYFRGHCRHIRIALARREAASRDAARAYYEIFGEWPD